MIQYLDILQNDHNKFSEHLPLHIVIIALLCVLRNFKIYPEQPLLMKLFHFPPSHDFPLLKPQTPVPFLSSGW